MLQLKNNNLKKKYTIKVPEDIQVMYCNIKNIVVFSKLAQKKSLKLGVKIVLIPAKNLIVVTSIPSLIGSKNFKKLQGTTVAVIRQQLIEMSYTLFTKLILVGVGYRVFPYEKVSNQVYFKLGYSHLVYFNIPNDLTAFCHKSTKMFLYGNSSYNTLTQTASQVRSCKIPEVYKGKGILYDQEKVVLKKGKKV
jgi:large subunit ribosomal protein L6